MYEYAIAWDWMNFAVRWLHVITGIAWIGSSFYFVALDLGLRQRPDLPAGAHGEEWQVHGGGFYHIQKYLVAPEQMPEHLTWFKWESYATWLSGFAMLCIVYYVGADLYLIDPHVLDVSRPVAIAISLASIFGGWIVYDTICKSPLGRNDTQLMVLLYFVLVGMAWGYTQLFTGRAAFLHLGAFTATIMSANVFMIIIPNQKKVVADLIAGKVPDPALGKQAKQRSTHNNYLTLPVLFLMLSNHYPLAFGTQVQLDHCLAGVPDGRHDPPLVQHPPRAQGGTDVDVAGYRDPLRHHHVAVDRAEDPVRRRRRGEGLGRPAAIHFRGSLPQGEGHYPRTLLDVPCQGTRLGGHHRATQGCRA